MDKNKEPKIISMLIAEQAVKLGDQPFLYYQDQVLSFAGLYQMAGQMAAGLRDAGIKRGQMIGVMLPNCPEYIALSFGISFLGAVEVPINIQHKGDILDYIIRKSDAGTLVVDASLIGQIADLEEIPANVRKIIVRRSPGDNTIIPDFGPIETIQLSEWSCLEPLSPDGTISPKDPYCLLFTSGTTGPSKGSLLPHNYVFHTIDVLTRHLEIDNSDCIYTFMPLFHNNAKLAAVMPALLHGCKLILAERFSQKSFWQEMRDHEVTLTNLIGGLVTGLLKQEPRAEDRDHCLRRVFTAAAGKKPSMDFEERFGVQVIEGYGMTETNMVLLNSVSRNSPGSIGRADCGFHVEIHDEQDAEVPAGVSGEIVVRPMKPYTMQLMYYGMPEMTLESCRNLWFHSGDLGYRNEAGDFFFLDRSKDSIRRMGENISSMELESIVSKHPAILENAAIAIPSEYGEDEAKLLVVLKKDARLEHAELHDYCSKHMARFMVPRFLEFRDELPKNPTGRIEKYKLRKEGPNNRTWDGKSRKFVNPYKQS